MGRDEHLCEQGLLEALDSGQLQVATLDVMQNEPSAENEPLLTTPRHNHDASHRRHNAN